MCRWIFPFLHFSACSHLTETFIHCFHTAFLMLSFVWRTKEQSINSTLTMLRTQNKKSSLEQHCSNVTFTWCQRKVSFLPCLHTTKFWFVVIWANVFISYFNQSFLCCTWIFQKWVSMWGWGSAVCVCVCLLAYMRMCSCLCECMCVCAVIVQKKLPLLLQLNPPDVRPSHPCPSALTV